MCLLGILFFVCVAGAATTLDESDNQYLSLTGGQLKYILRAASECDECKQSKKELLEFADITIVPLGADEEKVQAYLYCRNPLNSDESIRVLPLGVYRNGQYEVVYFKVAKTNLGRVAFYVGQDTLQDNELFDVVQGLKHYQGRPLTDNSEMQHITYEHTEPKYLHMSIAKLFLSHCKNSVPQRIINDYFFRIRLTSSTESLYLLHQCPEDMSIDVNDITKLSLSTRWSASDYDSTDLSLSNDQKNGRIHTDILNYPISSEGAEVFIPLDALQNDLHALLEWMPKPPHAYLTTVLRSSGAVLIDEDEIIRVSVNSDYDTLKKNFFIATGNFFKLYTSLTSSNITFDDIRSIETKGLHIRGFLQNPVNADYYVQYIRVDTIERLLRIVIDHFKKSLKPEDGIVTVYFVYKQKFVLKMKYDPETHAFSAEYLNALVVNKKKEFYIASKTSYPFACFLAPFYSGTFVRPDITWVWGSDNIVFAVQLESYNSLYNSVTKYFTKWVDIKTELPHWDVRIYF